MKWRTDHYWTEALDCALSLSTEHKLILTPDEFVNERAEFYPVSQALRMTSRETSDVTAFAIPKDDAGLLPMKILRDDFDHFCCVFANEVFVVYSSLAESRTLPEEMGKHVPFFLEERDRAFISGGGKLRNRTQWDASIYFRYPAKQSSADIIPG